MYCMPKVNSKMILLLIFILNNIIKADYSLEEKYYFQLYPSDNTEEPYLFYVFTPTSNIITINSTEGDNCKIIGNKAVNEYPKKDLSSVASLKDTLLIKTCFGPDKIVELVYKNNETYFYKNNNMLANVNYCYTTMVLDPLNQNQYVIMTYWSEFYLKNGKTKYRHKCITFNPITKAFSIEIVLTAYSNIIELFIEYNYYAKSCITFRNKDIYCSINLDSDVSYANSFIIETSKIYTSDPQIHLVISNTDYGKNVYQKPIAIGKEIHDSFGGFFDAFLTEYHNKEENKTTFVSTLFRKSLYTVFVPVSDKYKKYYGINVEDSYIDPNLFNHLLPNENDFIIIYLMKTRDSMGLIMTRFNLSDLDDDVKIHMKFQEYSLSNYLQEGICPNPKYMQSIYSTSFINYSNNDKIIINAKGSDHYYKYQKCIASFISCEDENKNVYYETKKINFPQCLNELDILNGKDFHTLRYKDGENLKTIDILNDPKYISLRHSTIEFYPIKVIGPIPIIIRITYEDGSFAILNYSLTNVVKNPIKIEFFITQYFRYKVPLSIPYRIKYTSSNANTTTCHLSSDICKFELVKTNDHSCDIEYCLYCGNNTKCAECDKSIEGILFDEDNNRCICDVENGFQMYPKLFNSIINMCVCKEDYSFYKNITLCRPNIELNGTYCPIRIDEVSSIPIYDNCENPTETETDIMTEKKSEMPFILNDDICLKNKSIDNSWFALGEPKFYFAKITDCVYIFDNNDFLFFYSDSSDCSFNNLNRDIEYISDCLNKPQLKNYNDYEKFLSDSEKYDPNDENITIYKETENYFFHLVKNQKNFANISDIELTKECEEILKSTYSIDNDTNLLIFKVDIKRDDTISRQVEYQFYNPNPRKIYEKLDLSYCIPDKNNTLNKTEEINRINITIPVDWTEKHFLYMDELYINHHILFLNPKEPFYNDVCFKYKTPRNNDIYLQERREKYFLLDPLCESNCNLIELVEPFDLNKDNYKIKCDCPLKLEPEVPENIKFAKKSLYEVFGGKYRFPNINVIKCGGKASLILFFTLILMIIFILSFLHRKFIGRLECLKDLQKEIEFAVGGSDDEDDNDDEKEHIFDPKKKKNKDQNNIKENKSQDDINNNINENKRQNNINNNINENQSQNNINNNINENKKEYQEQNNKNKIESQDQNKIINNKIENEAKDNKNKLFESKGFKKKEVVNLVETLYISNEFSNKKKEESSEINNNINKSIKKSESNLIDNNENNLKNSNENTKKSLISLTDSSRSIKSSSKLLRSIDTETEKTIKEEDKKEEDKKEEDKIEDDKKEEEGAKKEKENEDEVEEKEEKEKEEKKEEKDNEEEEKEKENEEEEDKKEEEEEEKEKENKRKKVIDKFNESIVVAKSILPTKPQYDKDENYNNDLFSSQKDKDSMYPSNPPRKIKGKTISNKKDNQESVNPHDINNIQGIPAEEYEISFMGGGNQNPNQDGINNNNNNDGISSSRNQALPPEGGGNDNIEETITSDYILNKSEFKVIIEDKKDNRTFWDIFLSMIQYNNTLAFVFYFCDKKDKNDYFVRTVVFVLTFNIYIFFNILFMFNTSSLHLYIDKDIDLIEKNKGAFKFVNLFLCPILFYLLSSVFKFLTSIREFMYDKLNESHEIKANRNLKLGVKILKIHDIKTEISKLINSNNKIVNKYFIGTLIFLIFNCCLVTCFCSIYDNSIDCLVLNIFMSLLLEIIITLSLFALSSLLRYIAIQKGKIPDLHASTEVEKQVNAKEIYNASRFLNPTYIMYEIVQKIVEYFKEVKGDD